MRGPIFGTRILLHMHVSVWLVCVNFKDEILLRGEECKTRMMKQTSPLNSSCEI